jgi:glycosyltransferase involved in cell wall biosynthesis
MQSLSIVSVYNRYLNRGGEDEAFESEGKLLSQYGCDVRLVTEQTQAPKNICEKFELAVECVWSSKWHKQFKALLNQSRPDVVHVHNVFPVISPSVYYACQEANIPVVQTLHNYRLLCPAATFYRNGRVCEDCVEHGLGRSVVHGCYQESRGGTSAIALMLQIHRKMNTWTEKIDRYIALTEFARDKFVTSGLPAEKLRVKPNFIDPDPGESSLTREYAIFVGRLVDWKGIGTVLAAWKYLPVPLVIVGDGPLQPEVKKDDYPAKKPSLQ